MAIDILSNCHFDATRVSKLYLGVALSTGGTINFPVNYHTLSGSSDSIIKYESWDATNVVQIGQQNIQFEEVYWAGENITFTEELIIDQRGRNYVKTLTFELSGIDQTLVDQLEALGLDHEGMLCPPKTLAILIDENENELIAGYDFPFRLESITTGINGDQNSITLTYISNSHSRARNVGMSTPLPSPSPSITPSISVTPTVTPSISVTPLPCFECGTGFNNIVYDIDIQSDGKILVGGSFDQYSGQSVTALVRLEDTGALNTNFDFTTSYTSNIATIISESDGKIIVGGMFNKYSGLTVAGLIRLTSTNELDTTFASDHNIRIFKISKQTDGKILVGGLFSAGTYSGITLGSAIARLDTNGYYDTTLNTGTGFYRTSDPRLWDICELKDGNILCAGAFTSYSGISASGIVLLDTNGTLINTFGTGTTSSRFARQSTYDNKIYIDAPGSFSGITCGGIIRLTTGYTIDETYNYSGIFAGGSIVDILFDDDGSIIPVGHFTSYSGITANRIIKLNNDGTINNTFNSGTGFDSYTDTIAKLNNGNYIIGGNFWSYNGYGSEKIAVILPDGTYYGCEKIPPSVSPTPSVSKTPSKTPSTTPSISISITPSPTPSS